MDTSVDIYTEQIGDVPLLLGLLQKMGLQPIVDAIIKPHGNRQGLSVGWTIVVWLVHILTEKTHCGWCPTYDVVREWVPHLQETLERLTGQTIQELDFTDDRLADILRYLSDDGAWHQIEAQWSQHLIRVYDLRGNRVRLDGTSASVYHDEETHALFKRGRSKDGQWDVQFRVMLGSLPWGCPWRWMWWRGTGPRTRCMCPTTGASNTPCSATACSTSGIAKWVPWRRGLSLPVRMTTI